MKDQELLALLAGCGPRLKERAAGFIGTQLRSVIGASDLVQIALVRLFVF
jgi:hypothetical protein